MALKHIVLREAVHRRVMLCESIYVTHSEKAEIIRVEKNQNSDFFGG